MLPLTLMKTALGHPMLVELKNGETYNGHLISCDAWMNLCLREVICTARDGDRFWRMSECYVRGNTIKYLRIPDEIIANVKEEALPRGSQGGQRVGKSNPRRQTGGRGGGRGGQHVRGGRGGRGK